ncbi:MAG: FHA domain-containing protein [Candidatus Gracilibacteria bacterium]
MTVGVSAGQSGLDDAVHIIEIRCNEAAEAGDDAGLLKKALSAMASAFGSRVASAAEPEIQERPIVVPLTKGEQAILDELFPKGLERSHFKQRNIGDCYFLAALYAIKQHPLGAKVIADMIRRTGLGWEVTFPGNEYKTITVGYEENLDYQIDKKGKKRHFADGQKGDNILERAFGRQRDGYGKRDDDGGPMKTVAVLIGGFCSEGFKAILADIAEVIDIGTGLPLVKAPYYKEQVLEVFKKQVIHPSNFIFTAITPSIKTSYREKREERETEFDDEYRYYMDPEKRFPCRHAYSIESVDMHSETLVIVNPWDTNDLKYRITFEKFFEYFCSVEGVEFDEQKIIKKFSDVVFQGDSIDIDEPQKLKSGLRYAIKGMEYAIIRFGIGEWSTTIRARINSEDELELESKGVIKHAVKNGDYFIVSREVLGGNSHVSNNHARIKYLGDGEMEIRDNNSTNGTTIIEIKHVDGYVPSKRLMPGQEEIYEMHNKDIELVLADTVTLLCVRREGRILIFQKGRVTPIAEMIPGDMKIIGCKDVLDLKKRVSKVHLELRNINGHLSVRDVMSKSGTVVRKVNEREVAVSGRV